MHDRIYSPVYLLYGDSHCYRDQCVTLIITDKRCTRAFNLERVPSTAFSEQVKERCCGYNRQQTQISLQRGCISYLQVNVVPPEYKLANIRIIWNNRSLLSSLKVQR